MRDFYKNIAADVSRELIEAWDDNFRNKAFFEKSWPETRIPNRRGSLMIRTGLLKNSIKSRLAAESVGFSSSMPYAKLHNEGGTMVVTTKMKRFFWAMFYKNGGKKSKSQSAEAGYWKALALKKVGSKLTIKQRQFIGHHPQVDIAVRRVIDDNFQEYNKELKNTFKT